MTGTGVSKVGVVFSSGFFGFFAHAGFLAALRELSIEPVAYAGASSGAIIAGMAASGLTGKAIREQLFSVKKTDFWDHDPWSFIFRKAMRLFKGYSGYLRGDGYAQLLQRLPVHQIEDCERPLAISVTDLTQKKETILTRGNLVKAIQASGAVPMLFKPVEIDGCMYVDGGIVNKAPLIALADLAQLDRIIVHFICSENLEERRHEFLRKRMALWHVQHLAVNIARQEAYNRQLEIIKMRGIDVIEVKTGASALGPDSLDKGPAVYDMAKCSKLKNLMA